MKIIDFLHNHHHFHFPFHHYSVTTLSYVLLHLHSVQKFKIYEKIEIIIIQLG